MLRQIDAGYEIARVDRRLSQGLRQRVAGFEDVLAHAGLDDAVIGEGHFYNTAPAIAQLATAVSLSSHEYTPVILVDPSLTSSADVVRELRMERVLEGMKILDIGCGTAPSFALAAKALGAEVHTADAQELPPVVGAMLDGHSVVDLNHADAVEWLVRATGGNFDLVTENIIGPVPENLRLPVPSTETLRDIGDALLRTGGYFHSAPDQLYIKA